MIYLLRLSSLGSDAPCSDVRKIRISGLKNEFSVLEARGAEAVLWHAFSDRYQNAAYPFDYQRTKYGKPYFERYPDFHFSLTHTKMWAACAVSDSPCGVDAERLGRIGESVISRVFHPLEREYLAALPEFEVNFRAAQIWCMREAYGKMKGGGLLSIPKDFYVLPDGKCSDKTCFFRLFEPDADHTAAFCKQMPLTEYDGNIVFV